MARLTLNGMFEYDPTLFEGMILPQDYDRDALFMEIMNTCGQLYPYHQQPSVLKSAIRLWFSRNYLNFDRIMDALISEYDPIENYNRHENWTRTPNLHDTETRSGTDTTAHSGDDTESHSGKDTIELGGKDTIELGGKDTVEASGTDTTTRSYTNYKETITNTGSRTTEEEVSAFDSSSYEPSKRTTETPTDLNEEKEISGSYADDLVHGKTEDTTYGKTEDTTYGKTEDTTYGKTEDTTYDSEVKNEYNSSEATTYGTTFKHAHTGNEQFASHVHGNIGVTTSQQMIQSEIELRQFDIYNDIARRFEREFIVQVY